jgi:hypothetical protein
MLWVYAILLNAFFFINLVVSDKAITGVAFSQPNAPVLLSNEADLDETEPYKVVSLGKVHLQPEYNDIAKELNIRAGEPIKSIPLTANLSVFKDLFANQALDGWQGDNDGEIFIAAHFAGNMPDGLRLEACLEVDCFIYNNDSYKQGIDAPRSIDMMPVTIGEIGDISGFNFVVKSDEPMLDFSSIMTIDVEAEFFVIYKE